MASLSLKNICKVYPNGFVAVKDFNLEVEDKELGLKESKKVLTQLEGIGQQLALAFNSDNSVLAVGGQVEILGTFFCLTQLKTSHTHASYYD